MSWEGTETIRVRRKGRKDYWEQMYPSYEVAEDRARSPARTRRDSAKAAKERSRSQPSQSSQRELDPSDEVVQPLTCQLYSTVRSASQLHIRHGGTRLPTTETGADGEDEGDGADVPCSFSASRSIFTSFSSMSAIFSPSCAGRAADHAWNSMMSSSSIALSSEDQCKV